MKKNFSETKLGQLIKFLKEGYPDVKNEYSDYSIFIENGISLIKTHCKGG